MSQEIDYTAVLADLERRRAELEAAIATVRAIVGHGGDAPALPARPSALAATGAASDVPPGTFHGKSISEGARAFLEMSKTKQKTRAICDALRKGGIETSAKSFYSNVYTILKRTRDFRRLTGGYWALAAWNPNAPPTVVARRPRKKSRKKAKPSAALKVLPKAEPLSAVKGAAPAA